MKKKEISHQDVQAAINKFMKSGGMIDKLPEQGAHDRRMVGEDKYQIYETLTTLHLSN